MNTSFHLYQLQKIDTETSRIYSRLGEIERSLASDPELEAAKANYQIAADNLQLSQDRNAGLEEEASQKTIKIAQSEASLYGGRIHSPKELQDLQAEIASLKKALAELEDRQMVALADLDEMEAAFLRQQTILNSAEAQRVSSLASLKGEQVMLGTQIQKLTKERDAILSQISTDEVKLYELLKERKRGIAVALITDSTCAACGTTLTAALCQLVRVSPNLQYCPTCGRILYIN